MKLDLLTIVSVVIIVLGGVDILGDKIFATG